MMNVNTCVYRGFAGRGSSGIQASVEPWGERLCCSPFAALEGEGQDWVSCEACARRISDTV